MPTTTKDGLSQRTSDLVTSLTHMVRDLEEIADRLGVPRARPQLTLVPDQLEPIEQKRLEVTDEAVYDALMEIHAQEPIDFSVASPEQRRAYNFPWASGVWRLLMQRQGLLVRGRSEEFDHSDLMRVVAALKRLERSGRVVQEVRYVYGQRRSSDWHPAVE